MTRRPFRRSMAVQAVALLLALVAITFIALRKAPGENDAFAATTKPANSAGIATQIPPPPPAGPPSAVGEPAPGGPASTLAHAAEPAQEPIDSAVAPDGGVPSHPGGGTYRSPFAATTQGHPPVRIKVGMLLNSIDDYDIKTGRYSADFFLSLTSDSPMPSVHLAFPNGKLDNEETLADKPTFKLFRFNGDFKSPPNLRRYPFDSQELKISIEDDFRGIDQIRFVVDKERTQLARGFRALGWQVRYLEARSISQSYPDRFENDDLIYGRYTFSICLERYATSAAFTVFVPAFVIVLISLLGMWVPPDEMEVRSNAGAPMLAAAVLFHFALMQELPATSYLTRADKLMLGVYVSLALGMLSTWWMFLVEEKHVNRVFVIARIAVPVLTVGVMAAACLY